MSRGGREVADVVETAWRAGARFDAWTELFSLDGWKAACEACGVSMEGIAQATYDTDYIPPWSHLSAGLFVNFLQRERRFAQQEKTTPDCTYDTCSACGVCMGLNTAIQTQEVRHG